MCLRGWRVPLLLFVLKVVIRSEVRVAAKPTLKYGAKTVMCCGRPRRILAIAGASVHRANNRAVEEAKKLATGGETKTTNAVRKRGRQRKLYVYFMGEFKGYI